MTANDNKSDLSYWKKVLKKPTDADYSALTEKIETNPKASKLKVNDRVRITKYQSISCKISQENYLLLILC